MTILDNDLLVYPKICLIVFQSFICCNAADIHVEIKEAYASDIISVATVAAKARTTAVAHPKSGLLFLFDFIC